jgi:large subunit ribosomal protein L25
METQALNAEVRETRGKGPARQLRSRGLIPAVFYGPGIETTAMAISPKELVKALETEYRHNVVLTLPLEGNQVLAMVKDIQVHPVSRVPVHVDFYRVASDRPVEVRVPLRTTGRAKGVVKGGKLTVVFRDVPVRTTPDKIPANITINVEGLDMGDVFKVSDLTLPEGVEVLHAPDRRLVLVGEDRKRVTDEEEAGAEAAAPATK